MNDLKFHETFKKLAVSYMSAQHFAQKMNTKFET
jgi:hypothetical protein